MRILWVTEGYAPNRNANGNCVYNLAKAMQQQGHDIAILTKALGPYCETTADLDRSLPLFWYRYDCDMQQKQIAALIKQDFFAGAKSLFAAMLGKLFFSFSRNNPPGFWHTKVIESGIKRTVIQYAPDVVIATVFPLETAAACANLKRSKKLGCPFFVYQLDSYVDNFTLSSKLQALRQKTIRKIYQQAQGVFAHPLLESEIEKTDVETLKHTTFVEFPALVSPEKLQTDISSIYYQKDRINCAYFGSLYGSIRNPTAMFTLFEKLDKNVHLHIFGQAHDMDFEPWKQRFQGRLHLHGEIPQKVCFSLMQTADILVNLGNTVANQLPSKIFQYFATGRPIINIISNPNCATLPYMEKYPIGITVCEQSIDQEANFLLIHCFLKNHPKDNSIFFECIKNRYIQATPLYVTKTLLTVIENVIK